LLFELGIILHGHLDGRYGKDGIEAGQPAVPELVKAVSFGLAIKVLKDVTYYIGDALRGSQRLFPVYIPNLCVSNIVLLLHGADVVYTEGKHILIVYGIYNGVGVQAFPKGLVRGAQGRDAKAAGINSKDRGAGKAEEIVFLKGPGNGQVHFTKLGAVALVKDKDNTLGI